MTLNRLASTTQQYSRETVERVRLVAGEMHRRVEAGEGVESDRQRSLQQELAEAEPTVVDAVASDMRMLDKARALAAELAALGAEADDLLRPPARPVVDDSA